MKTLFFHLQIQFKNHCRHPMELASMITFMAGCFFILGLLLQEEANKRFFESFYLFIIYFSGIFMVKDSWMEDFLSTRLQSLVHAPTPFMSFLVAKWLVHAFMLVILQLLCMPVLSIFSGINYILISTPFLVWGILSCLYLALLCLTAAAINIKSRIGSFLNIILTLPLLVPWFLITTEFMDKGSSFLVWGLGSLLMIMTPVFLGAQKLVLAPNR